MTLDDTVRNWAWWSSPEWENYCAAYDGTQAHRPISEPSFVVDLSKEIKPSKGHRYCIRQQMQTQHIRTCMSIDAFHRSHLAAAGLETRSQGTWDLMGEWLHNCHGVCVTNGVGGWAYLIIDHPGAYYASSAGPDTHFLQWKVITGLRDAGFDWYEMGAAHTPGIGTFKRGFSHLAVEP